MKKKIVFGVSESKILIHATIPLQSFCDMRTKEPRREGQYWANSMMQKSCLRGEG